MVNNYRKYTDIYIYIYQQSLLVHVLLKLTDKDHILFSFTFWVAVRFLAKEFLLLVYGVVVIYISVALNGF